MLSSNAEGFKKEAAAVTEKSQKLTLAVHKLQLSLDSVTQVINYKHKCVTRVIDYKHKCVTQVISYEHKCVN